MFKKMFLTMCIVLYSKVLFADVVAAAGQTWKGVLDSVIDLVKGSVDVNYILKGIAGIVITYIIGIFLKHKKIGRWTPFFIRLASEQLLGGGRGAEKHEEVISNVLRRLGFLRFFKFPGGKSVINILDQLIPVSVNALRDSRIGLGNGESSLSTPTKL